MVSKVLFSHKSDDYQTPDWLMDVLKEEFDFMLDACSTNENPTTIPDWYTKKENGLELPWRTWTYCNPPYSEVGLWVLKAFCERLVHGNGSVMLLPARTDTKWFHNIIYKRKDIEIRFLKGRLKFKDTKYSAPFPSMVVVFKP